MTSVWMELRPYDVLFFRGSEPYTAGETGYLPSEFPPSPQVIQGALRTGLLHANGIDVTEFRHGSVDGAVARRIVEAVGAAGQTEEMGLDLRGPFLLRRDTLYVPAPLDMLVPSASHDALGSSSHLHFARPSEQPTVCDLGRVRLPTGQLPGTESPADKWISLRALEASLRGERVERSELYDPLQPAEEGAEGYVWREPKVGLARDRRRRTASEGMLYTIAPLRMGQDLAFAVHADGVPEGARLPDVLTLGGEGRFAWVHSHTDTIELGTHRDAVAAQIDNTGRFRLALLQPALFEKGWLPDGFQRATQDGADVWRGTLAGIECTLISACLEKPRRIGGWDLARNAPKPLQHAVPAGSVYFFETHAPGWQVVGSLDNQKIGQSTRIGFGHCLVGGWE